jgi:tripartite-type tricarboxylate transporter receptor subunit TctC
MSFLKSILGRMSRAVVLPAAALLAATGASAAFPDRTITIIVPFNAGTTPDILSRMLADQIGRDVGQSVIVMNRVGASGIIGTQALINSPPDGYTVAYANVATLAINQALYKKLPYDADKQLAPVALAGYVQNVLVVRPGLGVKTVPELIALAKKKPGDLSVGSGGNGTTGHLSAEMFKSMAGVFMTHIPYKGGLEADLAVMRGEIDVLFENITTIAPYIASGKVVALGVTGSKRDPTLPNLPTMSEAGLKGYNAVAWTGYVAPAGVDPQVLDYLNKAFNAALNNPQMKARLAAMAFESTPGPRKALFDLAHQERPVWAAVVRKSGAAVD